MPGDPRLIPSDGGGIPYEEAIIPSGNSNFTQYQQSLEKLKPLDVEFFCADHYGYVTGTEAANYISRSIDEAAEKRADRSGIPADTFRGRNRERTGGRNLRNHPDYFLPPEICAGVYRQTVRHVAGVLEKQA